ncbi:hypothetical protein XH84_05740 [Bradyrhizobium nanningense]|nr:hypothetical protein XH84_05740 [Bradyrhizobium nanningense]
MESWVVYKLCRAAHAASLTKGVSAWVYRADETVSDKLFDKICQGIHDTEHIAPRMKRYFEGKGPAF